MEVIRMERRSTVCIVPLNEPKCPLPLCFSWTRKVRGEREISDTRDLGFPLSVLISYRDTDFVQLFGAFSVEDIITHTRKDWMSG
jgi:hypothetical protein